MQSPDLKCSICLACSLSLPCSLGFNQVGQQWLSDYFYLRDRKWVRTVLTVWEIARGCCRNIVRVRRNVMATWPTSPDQQGTVNRIVDQHLTTHYSPLTTLSLTHHIRILYQLKHLHDFLRRWDLMSLFEFFAGTKIQVKLSGSAPWGIQSLCLTYNAIIERMFFRESAQTIQRLRVGFAVRPP